MDSGRGAETQISYGRGAGQVHGLLARIGRTLLWTSFSGFQTWLTEVVSSLSGERAPVEETFHYGPPHPTSFTPSVPAVVRAEESTYQGLLLVIID